LKICNVGIENDYTMMGVLEKIRHHRGAAITSIFRLRTKHLLRELLAARLTIKISFRLDPSCVRFEEKETLPAFLFKMLIFGKYNLIST
jgi:hypothetical protein